MLVHLFLINKCMFRYWGDLLPGPWVLLGRVPELQEVAGVPGPEPAGSAAGAGVPGWDHVLLPGPQAQPALPPRRDAYRTPGTAWLPLLRPKRFWPSACAHQTATKQDVTSWWARGGQGAGVQTTHVVLYQTLRPPRWINSDIKYMPMIWWTNLLIDWSFFQLFISSSKVLIDKNNFINKLAKI